MAWASEVMVFLGILLNGASFCLSIPEEKRMHAINSLQKLIVQRKTTVRDLQQLTGFLNFLHKAIFTGTAFTRRMYAKYSGRVEKLKPYHHVHLDAEFKADCRIWLLFLESSMITTVARPFVDLNSNKELTQLEFYSDALCSKVLGMGARFEKQWTFAQLPRNFIKDFKPSIEFLELYGLVTAVYIWFNKLRNTRVVVFCDNESVMFMMNNSSSTCALCMKLIRGLVLMGLKHNFRIFARHLRSEENEIADSLSHLQFKKFNDLRVKYGLRAVAEPIPLELWPPMQQWNENRFYP